MARFAGGRDPRVVEPERRAAKQTVRSVRAQVNAIILTAALDVGVALVNGDVNARAMEPLRERQPGDTPTNDDGIE